MELSHSSIIVIGQLNTDIIASGVFTLMDRGKFTRSDTNVIGPGRRYKTVIVR